MPSSTGTRAILPKSAKTTLQIIMDLAAHEKRLDAEAILAITAMLDDRDFALKFKEADALIKSTAKKQRSTNKINRLQKRADKEGISLDTLQQRIAAEKTASIASDSE